MSVLRFLAPSLCVLFGLYCVIWGLVASSVPTSERIGSAFLGVLWLLLAYVYFRVILPHEQEKITRSDQAV
jgi:uncharacterized membrane protein YjfL (UPF0719 family)